ncbi:MAG: hypothetical protein ACI4JB_04715 [Porcipelethomonas sp.]
MNENHPVGAKKSVNASPEECKAVLSSILRNEEHSVSERLKAIDMLIKIGFDNAQESDIKITVDYGGINGNNT